MGACTGQGAEALSGPQWGWSGKGSLGSLLLGHAKALGWTPSWDLGVVQEPRPEGRPHPPRTAQVAGSEPGLCAHPAWGVAWHLPPCAPSPWPLHKPGRASGAAHGDAGLDCYWNGGRKRRGMGAGHTEGAPPGGCTQGLGPRGCRGRREKAAGRAESNRGYFRMGPAPGQGGGGGGTAGAQGLGASCLHPSQPRPPPTHSPVSPGCAGLAGGRRRSLGHLSCDPGRRGQVTLGLQGAGGPG